MRYRQMMQKRVLEISESETPWNVDERWAKIRRDSFVGAEARKHDVLEARRLLQEGMTQVGLYSEALISLKKSDPRKMVVAWLIRRNTAVRNEWIIDQLHMGRVSKLSYFVKQVEDAESGILLELKKKVKR